MKEICNYWVTKFNWKKHEEEINKFSNFKTDVDGIEMHFIQEKGSRSNATPLLITHGWPGSITESLNINRQVSSSREIWRKGGRCL